MSTPPALEPEFIDALRDLFEQRIAFNRLIGLRITEISAGHAHGELDMRSDLIGHDLHQRLHGGVISSVLDAMAGIAILGAMGARHLDEPIPVRMQRFAKLGTIDLRIDYLRQANGQRFKAHGEVLRLGSRIASTRMEFMDESGALVAAGSSAYIVS